MDILLHRTNYSRINLIYSYISHTTHLPGRSSYTTNYIPPMMNNAPGYSVRIRDRPLVTLLALPSASCLAFCRRALPRLSRSPKLLVRVSSDATPAMTTASRQLRVKTDAHCGH